MIKSLSCLLLLIGLFITESVFAQPELDTSFDGDGMFYTGTSFTFAPADTVIQPDNKSLSVSMCRDINVQSYQFCFIRLNENGSFDTTFEDNYPLSAPGTSLYKIPGADPNGHGGSGFALQSDGKIVGVGSATISGSQKPVMIRLNSSGTVDSTFGTNGVFVFSIDGYFTKNVIQPDGKIVIVGASGGNQMAARFLADGTPDDTFGTNGFKILINPGGDSRGNSVALQADGKIIIGGGLGSASYLITRLNRDGSLDTTFDDDGYKNIPSNGTDGFISIAAKSDGRIAALGGRNILCQLDANGSLDTSFDSDGLRSALNGNTYPRRMLVSASGKITVVGLNANVYGSDPSYYRTARYLANGSPDSSYSDDGFLEINITNSGFDGADSAAFDRQGRLFIGGRAWSGSGDAPWQYCQFSAARLLAPPAQNVGFSGKVTKSDGRAVVNAYLTLKNGSEIVGYARTNPFGYFHFTNVTTNITYTLSTVSKNLDFYDRNVLVDDAIENYLVVGE